MTRVSVESCTSDEGRSLVRVNGLLRRLDFLRRGAFAVAGPVSIPVLHYTMNPGWARGYTAFAAGFITCAGIFAELPVGRRVCSACGRVCTCRRA